MKLDAVLRLLVLVNHGILTLDLFEDGNLCLDMLGLHEQLGAVDQSFVPGMVETVRAHGELVPHISLQSHSLFVPDQLVIAVSGSAVGIVQGLVIQNGNTPIKNDITRLHYEFFIITASTMSAACSQASIQRSK